MIAAPSQTTILMMKTPEQQAFRRTWAFVALVLVLLFNLSGMKRVHAAESLAVFDLDGYGISYDNALLMSQAIRDAFLEEGSYEPMDAYQLADRLSAGHEGDLRRARELLAVARQKTDAGRTADALKDLGEVLRLHQVAWSRVSRRPELADAHYFTAVALVKAGRTTEAVDHLVETFYYYPGYDRVRAPNPPPVMRPLLIAAQKTLAGADRRSRSASEIANAGRILGVMNIVVGRVSADGTVALTLYHEATLAAEASDAAPSIPLEAGHVFFRSLVESLVVASPNAEPRPVAAAAPSVAEPSEFHELPSLDEPSTSPDTSTPFPSRVSDLDDPGPSSRKKSVGKIHAKGSIRVQRSLTEQWWFWTSVGVVVLGGGYLIVTQVGDDSPTVLETPARHHYKVVVDTSGL